MLVGSHRAPRRHHDRREEVRPHRPHQPGRRAVREGDQGAGPQGIREGPRAVRRHRHQPRRGARRGRARAHLPRGVRPRPPRRQAGGVQAQGSTSCSATACSCTTGATSRRPSSRCARPPRSTPRTRTSSTAWPPPRRARATYLFAIARNNGTVDLIVRAAVRSVGGCAASHPLGDVRGDRVLTAIGAASPAACAIVGPIALGFAGRYRISPLMMGMFVVHGAQAGGFSPISIYGAITHSVMADNDLPVTRGHLPEQPADQPRHRRRTLLHPRRSPALVPAPQP